MYPGFTKSILDFGFVKDIDINEESNGVYIEVDISSSAKEVEMQLRDDITKKLQLIGADTIDVVIKKPKTNHPIKVVCFVCCDCRFFSHILL